MAKLERLAGATSELWDIFIQNATLSTGAGLAGLTTASAGLTWSYHRNTATQSVAVTLAAMSLGTFTSGGFREINSVSMTGMYQICPPNLALAAGASNVSMLLQGAANMVPVPIEVQLMGSNPDVALSTESIATQVWTTVSSRTVTVATMSANTITNAVIATDAIGSNQLSSGAIAEIAGNVWSTTATRALSVPLSTESIATMVWTTSAARTVNVNSMSVGALAQFFTTDSGQTYAGAVAGSVAKEIADNAGGSSLSNEGIATAVWTTTSARTVTVATVSTNAITQDGLSAGAIAEIAGNVWSTTATRALSVPLSTESIATQVWTTSSSRTVTVSTFSANAVTSASIAPDALTATGAHSSLIAEIAGNVWATNATKTIASVSSLTTESIATQVWTTTSPKNVTASAVTDKTGYSLATAPPTANEVAAAVLDTTSSIETNIDLRAAIRLILASQAGNVVPSGSTAQIYNAGNSKVRITATVASTGQRTVTATDTT
jgi:microcompartment protein CcmK/EutM